MKTIVIKLNEFPHFSETFVVAQIITAIKLGFEVKIIIRKFLDNNSQFVLIEQYELLDKIIIEDYQIPKNRIVRFFKWCLLFLNNFKEINYINKFYTEFPKFSLTPLYQWHFYQQFNEVEIIHIQYGINKNPVDILKKTGYFKPKVIVTFHGHDAFFPIGGFIQNNGYYNNLFKFGNMITANTPYLADKILELGCPGKLLSIVPVSVDTDFFYPVKKLWKKDEKINLITVGRLSKVKGQIYAFEAVNKLKDLGYNVVLRIIGEGVEKPNLEKFIIENKLTDSILFLGVKSREEIRSLLWESDIFLFSSVSLHFGSKAETQGLATIEAQACGLPVVVFDSGGVKYTVKDGETGFVVPEYDTEAMTSRIVELIKNHELREKMGRQAVEFVNENYSQKVIDEKWKYLYGSLSNGK